MGEIRAIIATVKTKRAADKKTTRRRRRKIMKKILTLIMTAILGIACVFGLTACGEKETTKIKVINVDLSNEQYAFAIKKGDTAMKESVNNFFKEKKTEIDAIFAKYTAEGVDLSTFGLSDVKTTPTIGSDSELVVATNLDFAPFEYTNGNKIAGIDMEIAQELAKYLNKTLVIVHMEFDAVVNSVSTKPEYNIGIAGLTITPDREEEVDFSDPYFGATQCVVVKADDTTFDGITDEKAMEAKLKELTGKAAKCGGQKATTSQFYVQGSEDFGFEGFKNLTFSPYSSAALAVTDMLNGNIAFVVVDKTTANALANSFNS